MSDYKHGSMDVKDHEKDFGKFVEFAIRVCAIALFVLIFLVVFNS